MPAGGQTVKIRERHLGTAVKHWRAPNNKPRKGPPPAGPRGPLARPPRKQPPTRIYKRPVGPLGNVPPKRHQLTHSETVRINEGLLHPRRVYPGYVPRKQHAHTPAVEKNETLRGYETSAVELSNQLSQVVRGDRPHPDAALVHYLGRPAGRHVLSFYKQAIDNNLIQHAPPSYLKKYGPKTFAEATGRAQINAAGRSEQKHSQGAGYLERTAQEIGKSALHAAGVVGENPAPVVPSGKRVKAGAEVLSYYLPGETGIALGDAAARAALKLPATARLGGRAVARGAKGVKDIKVKALPGVARAGARTKARKVAINAALLPSSSGRRAALTGLREAGQHHPFRSVGAGYLAASGIGSAKDRKDGSHLPPVELVKAQIHEALHHTGDYAKHTAYFAPGILAGLTTIAANTLASGATLLPGGPKPNADALKEAFNSLVASQKEFLGYLSADPKKQQELAKKYGAGPAVIGGLSARGVHSKHGGKTIDIKDFRGQSRLRRLAARSKTLHQAIYLGRYKLAVEGLAKDWKKLGLDHAHQRAAVLLAEGRFPVRDPAKTAKALRDEAWRLSEHKDAAQTIEQEGTDLHTMDWLHEQVVKAHAEGRNFIKDSKLDEGMAAFKRAQDTAARYEGYISPEAERRALTEKQGRAMGFLTPRLERIVAGQRQHELRVEMAKANRKRRTLKGKLTEAKETLKEAKRVDNERDAKAAERKVNRLEAQIGEHKRVIGRAQRELELLKKQPPPEGANGAVPPAGPKGGGGSPNAKWSRKSTDDGAVYSTSHNGREIRIEPRNVLDTDQGLHHGKNVRQWDVVIDGKPVAQHNKLKDAQNDALRMAEPKGGGGSNGKAPLPEIDLSGAKKAGGTLRQEGDRLANIDAQIQQLSKEQDDLPHDSPRHAEIADEIDSLVAESVGAEAIGKAVTKPPLDQPLDKSESAKPKGPLPKKGGLPTIPTWKPGDRVESTKDYGETGSGIHGVILKAAQNRQKQTKVTVRWDDGTESRMTPASLRKSTQPKKVEAAQPELTEQPKDMTDRELVEAANRGDKQAQAEFDKREKAIGKLREANQERERILDQIAEYERAGNKHEMDLEIGDLQKQDQYISSLHDQLGPYNSDHPRFEARYEGYSKRGKGKHYSVFDNKAGVSVERDLSKGKAEAMAKRKNEGKAEPEAKPKGPVKKKAEPVEAPEHPDIKKLQDEKRHAEEGVKLGARKSGEREWGEGYMVVPKSDHPDGEYAAGLANDAGAPFDTRSKALAAARRAEKTFAEEKVGRFEIDHMGDDASGPYYGVFPEIRGTNDLNEVRRVEGMAERINEAGPWRSRADAAWEIPRIVKYQYDELIRDRREELAWEEGPMHGPEKPKGPMPPIKGGSRKVGERLQPGEPSARQRKLEARIAGRNKQIEDIRTEQGALRAAPPPREPRTRGKNKQIPRKRVPVVEKRMAELEDQLAQLESGVERQVEEYVLQGEIRRSPVSPAEQAAFEAKVRAEREKEGYPEPTYVADAMARDELPIHNQAPAGTSRTIKKNRFRIQRTGKRSLIADDILDNSIRRPMQASAGVAVIDHMFGDHHLDLRDTRWTALRDAFEAYKQENPDFVLPSTFAFTKDQARVAFSFKDEKGNPLLDKEKWVGANMSKARQFAQAGEIDKSATEMQIPTSGQQLFRIAETSDEHPTLEIMPRTIMDELVVDTHDLHNQFGRSMDVLRRASRVQAALVLQSSLGWVPMQIIAEGFPLALDVPMHKWPALYKRYKELSDKDSATFDAYTGGVFGWGLGPKDLTKLGVFSEKDAALVHRLAPNSAKEALFILQKLDAKKGMMFRRIMAMHQADKLAESMLKGASGAWDSIGGAVEGMAKLKDSGPNARAKYLLEHPKLMREIDEHVRDMMGDWVTLTSHEILPASFTFFYPMVRYTTRFVLHSFPKRHPLKAFILYTLGQANTQEIMKLLGGVDQTFMTPLMAGVLFNGGENIPVDVARASPGGNSLFEAGITGFDFSAIKIFQPAIGYLATSATQVDPTYGNLIIPPDGFVNSHGRLLQADEQGNVYEGLKARPDAEIFLAAMLRLPSAVRMVDQWVNPKGSYPYKLPIISGGPRYAKNPTSSFYDYALPRGKAKIIHSILPPFFPTQDFGQERRLGQYRHATEQIQYGNQQEVAKRKKKDFQDFRTGTINHDELIKKLLHEGKVVLKRGQASKTKTQLEQYARKRGY